jgi:hypothetical protein
MIPPRPLEVIVEDPLEPDEPPEACEECGAPIERPTGTPACPETALDIAMYQLRFLAEAREDGTEDLFELLDELDAREWEHLDRGEPVTPNAREHWRDERDELPPVPPDLRVAHRAGRRSREPGPRPAPRRSITARRAPQGPARLPHAGAAAREAWPGDRTERPLSLRLRPEVQALLPRSGPRAAPAGTFGRGGFLK